MSVRPKLLIAALVTLTAACGQSDVSLACKPMAEPADVAARPSPYDSVRLTIGDRTAQVCYSRPSAKGRVVFGGIVPFDSLWRTGANEPTILHLPFDAEIAGLSVPAGDYSIYTVPRQVGEWQLVINRSTSQWGITLDAPRPDGGVNRSAYTAEVAAQELGRAPVSADSIEFVEQFTIRSEPAEGGASVLLEWERMRVRIPMRSTAPAARQ